MQPIFLPWIGYFSMISKVDKFVLLDNVQFNKRSWQQRNKIKAKNDFILLTVPVVTKGLITQNILDVRINNSEKYIEKHIASIIHLYSKTKYFNDYAERIFEIYHQKFTLLSEMNIAFIKLFCDILNIKKDIPKASSINISGKREYLLLNICKYYDAKIYLSAPGSSNYLTETNLFETNNIKIEYFKYEHPVYHQVNGKFMPYLSIIDLIFNEGKNGIQYI
mgnify:CR=1 FL=1